MNLSYNKKIIKAGASVMAFAVGFSLIMCGSNLKNQNESTKTQESVENYDPQKSNLPQKNEEKIVSDYAPSEFLIKEYKGSVAVFENGKNLPIRTTETMVADLPETDRELLKNGINVESREELLRILEDYCS